MARHIAHLMNPGAAVTTAAAPHNDPNIMTGMLHVVILAAVLALPTPLPVETSTPNLSLREVLVLGEATGDPNSMFGDPTFVGVDQSGHLYVVDQLALRIKVFSREGAFARSIGGRGRGEGKFLSIAATNVSPDGTVLVADQIASRFIQFPRHGQPVTFDLNQEEVTWPRSIVQSRTGYYLLYRLGENRNVVHRFGPDLNTRLSSLVDLRDVISTTDPFIEDFSHIAPGTLVSWRSKLAFAPSVCTGRIATVDMRNGGVKVEILRGATPERVLEIVPATSDAEDLTTVSGPNGQLAARLFCKSAGLASLGDAHLGHFSVRGVGSDKQLFAEVFDADGHLILSRGISEFELPNAVTSYLQVQVFNAGRDRVAFIDRRGNHPLIRVFEFRIS